jgi:hypothetical protein
MEQDTECVSPTPGHFLPIHDAGQNPKPPPSCVSSSWGTKRKAAHGMWLEGNLAQVPGLLAKSPHFPHALILRLLSSARPRVNASCHLQSVTALSFHETLPAFSCSISHLPFPMFLLACFLSTMLLPGKGWRGDLLL